MKTLAAIVLLMPLAGLALADTVTIDLPGLAGGYEAAPFTPPDPGYPQARTVDITIPEGVTAIDQLAFVVSGDWHVGEATCDDGSGPQVSPFDATLSLYFTSDAFPGDFFRAGILPPDGPFTDLAATVGSCCPPGVLGYEALLGADLHVELYVEWALVGFCWVSEDSYGMLDDVRLEIVGVVATEPTSWSAVKALYR